MEKYPKYKEDLVRGGIALFTTALALATIVVVIYAWVSGSKEAEEFLKILASFVALGAILIAVLTFYIEKRQ